MTQLEERVLAIIDMDVPCSLVESFSTMVREHPRDVDRAVDLLLARLRGYGVP